MENLKRDVSVNVCTLQKDEDGKSEINANYKGTMYYKSGVCHVFYTEYSDEGEILSRCKIKCGDGVVEIKRDGSYASRLQFQQGKTFKTVYSTPYGDMPVVTKTKRVLSAVDSMGGKIILDYSMSVAGNDFVNNVVISIEVLD